MNPALSTEPGQFGKYLLVERLGRGGMAEVWKAKISGPAGFSRTLVVKRILPHLVEDPHFVQMFVSEARLSARLNHANIVQVFELGDVAGEYYLAMEYVRGRDVVSVGRAHSHKGPPPPGLGAFVVREVCRALAYAHGLDDERGQPLRLIHRDVSPSNVMISFDGAVKLLDFGIAKALAEANENRTVTGTLKGKFGYMAPEQVEGKEIDHRADLFAAGVVLYEMLTGKRLFKGGSDLQTIAMVRDAKVDPPSLVNPAVPPELDEICLRSLARDPDLRWQGCDDLAMALDEVVHQLKWGPERLSAMLRDLFPDEPPTSSITAIGDAETRQGANLNVSSLRRYDRRGRLRLAWGAAALALLGGAGWLIAARMLPSSLTPPSARPATLATPLNGDGTPALAAMAKSTATTTPAASTAGATPTATGPAAAAPLSATVMLRVVSSPVGADVYLAGESAPRGRTPLALTLARSNSNLTLLVRLRGYEAQSAEVTPDSDSRLQLTLNRVAPPRVAAARPHRTAPHKPSPPPHAAEPPVPDLHRGDVVDPFAR